jgi:hypothetical protein
VLARDGDTDEKAGDPVWNPTQGVVLGMDPCATLPHDLHHWCTNSRELCIPTSLDAVRTVRSDESERYHKEREHNPWADMNL